MNTLKEGIALREAGFNFSGPFSLMLQQKDELRIESVLRIVPGRRMVVNAVWQNKRVIAKFFFDKRHAKRHIDTELAGIKLLQERNIPTPAVFLQAQSQDQAVFVLIFEQLYADIDLARSWQQPSLRDQLMPMLKMLVVEIATQHVFGLVQSDLHFNNFFIANNVIYTLDSAQIESLGTILPKKQSMQNLALLLSQLGVDTERYQEELFKEYVKARGWIWKNQDLSELFFMIDSWTRERWKKFEKKIFRNSTQFCHAITWQSESVCERSYALPGLLGFMQSPDDIFNRADVTMLKRGRSSTVIRVNLDGHDLVIKRYNIKSIWHWLRRCLRTTRAKKCWRIAHKLSLIGVKTAKPVAYIETNFSGLRGKSYLVTEYVPGEDVKDYLQSRAGDVVAQNKMIAKTCSLFASLKKIAITHGDMKSTNILVNFDDEPVLIDLDGACEHRTLATLQRTSQMEWQRFLKNFDGDKLLKDKFIYGTIEK